MTLEIPKANFLPANSPLTLSLVLPAWNEGEVIAVAVAEADAALRSVVDRYEIIVVDDGSTDDTAIQVQQIAATNPSVKLVQHHPNQGYGAALRSGFAAATMDLVAFTDADCQFDLGEMDRMLLLARRYDVVCGYRIDRKDSFLRCLYSRVYNAMVRTLLGTGVRDVDCALKVFRRDAMSQIKISGNGFLVNSEMLVQAHRHGMSVVEVGVSHRPRTAGQSTVSIHHIPKVIAALARFWWNDVQFPQRAPSMESASAERTSDESSSDSSSSSTPSASKLRWMQFALLIIAAVFMLTNLNYPLIDRDETRYAEIPREMITSGNWILPQLNFEPYYDKPPLVYWMAAISFKLFGVSAFAARLVPAIASLLTIAATMWFANRNFDRRVGLLSGAILMLSVGFAFTSRYLLLDSVLALMVSMSLFTAYEAIKTDRLRMGWWVASAVFIGLAFLTKGPLAIVLWLPPVLAMTWLTESMATVHRWHYAVIGLVASLIAVPWFVAVSFYDANFVYEFFVTHNVRRFAGEFHAKPIWYFVPVLLIAGHPWSFLTIPYLGFLFGRNQRVRTCRPALVGYLMLCSGWCFVFFSVSSCKLPTYLLPAAAPLALMLGHYLDLVLRESVDSSHHWFAKFWSARSATATTCLAGVGFVLYNVLTDSVCPSIVYLWAMLWTTLLVSSVILLNDRHQAKLAWFASSGFSFLFAVMVMHQLLPAYSRSQTLFGESPAQSQRLAITEGVPVATIQHEFSEVPFYLSRSDVEHFADIDDAKLDEFIAQHPKCVLVVEKSIPTSEVRHHLPEGTELVAVSERGPAKIYEVHSVMTQPSIAKPPVAGKNRVLR